MKRNIWIWQVRRGGGWRGRQSGCRIGDVGPKARWPDGHWCMVKNGRIDVYKLTRWEDRGLVFNGNLFTIRFFVLCFFLRCGLDIQWHPARDMQLCQESALSIWLWGPSEWQIVGLKGSDCEFHSRFMVKSSQVKGRIQVPSGCWILLYTMNHTVFAQYDSCFSQIIIYCQSTSPQ